MNAISLEWRLNRLVEAQTFLSISSRKTSNIQETLPLPIQTPGYLQISNRQRLEILWHVYGVKLVFLVVVLFREIHRLVVRCIVFLRPNRVHFKSGGTLMFVRPRAFREWQCYIIIRCSRSMVGRERFELQF